jgi:ubiquinone/menaquinone biosynthesis C-methylase UbiE
MESIKDIYNNIAHDFNRSRIRIWKNVAQFIDALPTNSKILDVGCGNGKNMLYRTDLQFYGIDISNKLIDICKEKNLNVIEASMTNIPFDDDSFDGMICIASYHHLSNDDDRKQALDEMYRLLKNNGLLLITVWAMEQPSDSTFNFTKTDEYVKWTNVKDGKTYFRYYHIYNENDLENEIKRLKPEFKIINVGYEKGNWNIILSK